MKLHLGCGEHYLKGYLNIDFPSLRHSVQKKTVADKFADILKLNFPPGSIEEIRLHHVFEHFPRAVACALLTGWHTWLENHGILRIEVPDLEKMFRNYNCLAQRHIFGSQEASWAYHLCGYTTESIGDFLTRYGFGIKKIKKNNWKGTANIEVFAVKEGRKMSLEEFEKITRKYLSQFLLDNSSSERELFKVWMKNYNDQIKK